MKMYKLGLVCLLSFSLLPQSYAANVPAGEKLAKEQILRKSNGAEIETLDPQKATDVQASNILLDLYEGLVSEAPDGRLVPGVASHWEMSKDGTEYTFYLRNNAKWSTGESVTATDFVVGMQRVVDPKVASPYATILAPIKNAAAVTAGKMPVNALGVKAIDDHTVKISLGQPTPYFLQLMAHTSAYPIYRPALQKYGEQFTQPGRLVSNGAYKLTEWVVQSHITLERNPYYWDNVHTAINKVVYFPIEDKSADLKKYRAGELDFNYQVPMAQIHWIKQNMKDEFHNYPQLATYYYSFNVTQPPLNNPNLRKALTLAIDREAITQKILDGGQIPAYGFVPPGVANYPMQSLSIKNMATAERIREAQQAYQAAGYSKDHPAVVKLTYNTDEDHKRIAVAVAAMWAQALGVKTEIINQEWKVFLRERREHKNTEVTRNGWVGDYNDPNTFLDLMLSTNPQNDSGYVNLKYDSLLQSAAVELNTKKRAMVLANAEQMMLNDYGVMPIYFYTMPRLIKPYVGGYVNNILDHHYTKDLYIKQHVA